MKMMTEAKLTELVTRAFECGYNLGKTQPPARPPEVEVHLMCVVAEILTESSECK